MAVILFIEDFVQVHELIADHGPCSEFWLRKLFIKLGFTHVKQSFGIGKTCTVMAA
jgi:hypothetical protein